MWSRRRQYLDGLRAAEQQLLHFAGLGSRCRVLDVPIPRTRVPLSNHSDQSYETYPDHYLIHGIQIDSEDETVQVSSPRPPPLVLLHGYYNGGAYFYKTFQGLSKYFPRIFALDLLGWGLSSRPVFVASTTDHAEDFFVESLEAWREVQKIDKMILAGHSMGGYISVAYCERYPERVERLILLSPVGVPEEDAQVIAHRRARLESSWRGRTFWGVYSSLFDRQYSLGDLLRWLPFGRSRSFLQNYVEKRLPAIQDPGEQQALTDYLYYNATLPGSGEYALHRILTPHIFAQRPLVHRIPQLKVRHVSFLYGDHDWMDPRGGTATRDASPSHLDIQCFTVPQAGHLLLLENPQGCHEAMVRAAGLQPEE